MIDGTDDAQRLRQARHYFESTIDFYDEWFTNVEEDMEFHHGRQWVEADVRKLRREMRPALTFNVVQGKILHMMGANEDNLMTPRVAGVDANDAFTAKVLDKLLHQLADVLELDVLDSQVFEDGLVAGQGAIALDAEPDPTNPSFVRIFAEPLWPSECIWDPAVKRRDKADARFLFWSRWMDKDDFRSTYPEMTDAEVDEVFEYIGDHAHSAVIPDWRGGTYVEERLPDWDTYKRVRTRLYFDRQKQMVRVIHMEYRTVQHRVFAVSSNTGRYREIKPSSAGALRERFGKEMHFVDSYDEVVKWFEFTGTKTLYDDFAPVFKRNYSVIPWVCFSDENNIPYGMVRNLKDPNREVNKRYSQTLHIITSQSAPGYIAETGAVDDVDRFRRETLTAAGVATVNAGAISGGKIKEREIPRLPEGLPRMMEISMRLFDLISGVHPDDMITPRGVPEAAATTQLKHRKSMLAMRPMLRTFQRYQREIAKRVLEVVMAFMPDEQVATLLADEDLKISGGIVTDAEGKEKAALRDIRTLRYKVKMRPADENNTERMLQTQLLLAVAQIGVPISPDVLFDVLILPEDFRARLKAFAKEAGAQQQMLARQEMQMSQQTLMQEAQLDAARIQADIKKSSDAHSASLTRTFLDFWAKVAAVMEKGDASEKRLIADLASSVISAYTSNPQQESSNGSQG